MAPAFGTGSRDIAHDKVLCIAIVSQSVPPLLSTLDANRLGRAPRRQRKSPLRFPSSRRARRCRSSIVTRLPPRGVRGHISIAAFVRGSHLCSAVPCSDNRQVKSASSRKSCGRSGLMNLFAMRYWRSRSVARVSGGATHGGRRYIRGRLIRARMRRGLWGPGCALIHDPHRLEAQRG